MGKSIYHDFKEIKKHARELRSTLTGSEELLWKELRNRRLSGYKFLRQHTIVYKAYYKGLNYFISDFYCNEKKAVIELDGPIHETTFEYDEFRDFEMDNLGIHVSSLAYAGFKTPQSHPDSTYSSSRKNTPDSTWHLP